MKKIYLVLIMLLAVFGLSQSGWAQTTIADGLIKVSDDTNEYWYYIENGHSSGTAGIVNDNDGRFCNLITIKACTADNTYAGIMPLQVPSTRDEQKWKVVDSATEGQYYLVNKSDNGYLKAIMDSGSRFKTVNSQLEGDKFTFTVYGTSVKMETTIGSTTYKVEGQNSNSDWQIKATTGGNPALNTTSGLTSNPRAWHFVEADKLENFYPVFHEQSTLPANATGWFYIKTLDPNKTEKYLTAGDSGFSLADKDAAVDDNQLFAFISGGVIAESTYFGGTVMYIYNKGTGKYISTSGALSETASNLYIKHVYSPKNPEQPIQGIIKTQNRGGSFFTSGSTSISMTAVATSTDTYDNGNVWSYEIASFSVAVNGGDPVENVTILTENIPATVESGEMLSITYKVGPDESDGFMYNPIVTVNGGAPLPATSPDENGVYTLSLIVTDNTTISIAAEKAENVITFDLTGVENNSVTINSPVLEGGKFTTGNVLTVEYSLAAGYTVPTIAANDANVTVGTPTLSGGKYTVAVSNISQATTLTFTNAVITYNVTLPGSGNGIAVVTTNTEANYFDDYTFTFTVAGGYNHPQVYANGIYVSPVKNGNSYTATISNVREDLEITARAFQLPENVIPVAMDTYITDRGWSQGPDNRGTNYNGFEELWIQASKDEYNRISYLEFDLSGFNAAQYNTAYLKLIYKSKQSKDQNPVFQARTMPAEMPALDVLTWYNSGESRSLNRKGVAVGVSKSLDRTTVVAGETILELNVTDPYVLNNLGSSDIVRLAATCIESTTNNTDPNAGYYIFYSREGAIAANNMEYMPVLVFENSETLTWEGSSSEWKEVSNWDKYIVPREFDNVIIPNLGKNAIYPQLSENTSIANLVIKEGAEIDLNDNTLTVKEKVSIEKTAAIDSDGYWMSIGFPFEVSAHSSYYDSKGWGSQLYPHGYSFSDYWLKYYDNDEFKYYSTNEFLAANKGYNALFPNAFNSFRAIEFRGNNVTIAAPQQLDITKDGSYQLVANPTLAKYPIEDNTPENYYYYKYDSNNNNYKRIASTGDEVAPFEAFIVVYNANTEEVPLRSIIIGNEENDFTNIDNVRDDLDIVIATKYYNLQGVEISKPADTGVYIVKKTLQSGKEVTEKVINTNR